MSFFYLEFFFIHECQQRGYRAGKATFRGQLFIIFAFMKQNSRYRNLESVYGVAKSSVQRYITQGGPIVLAVMKAFLFNTVLSVM